MSEERRPGLRSGRISQLRADAPEVVGVVVFVFVLVTVSEQFGQPRSRSSGALLDPLNLIAAHP